MIGWGLLTGNDPTAYRTLYPDQIPTMDTIRDAWKIFKTDPRPAIAYLKEIWLNYFSANSRVLSQFRNYEFLKQINFWCLIVGLIAVFRKRKRPEFLFLFGVWLVITIQAPSLHYIIARLVSPVYGLLSIIPGIGLQTLFSMITPTDRESGRTVPVPVISKAPVHSFMISARAGLCFDPGFAGSGHAHPGKTGHDWDGAAMSGRSELSGGGKDRRPDPIFILLTGITAVSNPGEVLRLPEMDLDTFLHNEILGFDDRLFAATSGSALFIRDKTFILVHRILFSSSDEPVLNLCGTRWGTYQFLFEAADYPEN